jgi:adenine phosphoribosyltransferase
MSDNSPKDVFTITPDWPRKGVRFFHMGPWLQNQAAFKADLLTIARRFSHLGITHIVYLGSRGFLLIPLSQLMNAKSVIFRKKGEMPPPVVEETYSGEYRDNTTIVISQGDIQKGARVLIVDDVLATGGTALASIKLVEKVGGQVVGLPSCWAWRI